MNKLIRNPVSHNPWAPEMPNNFQGCEAAKIKKNRPPQLIHFKVTKQAPSRARRTRKPSVKLQMTQNYADQLAPLYPFLNKTQVKSALTLANNNLYQSRLLLDVTNKFLKTNPGSQSFSFSSKTLSEGSSSLENKSSTELETTVTLNSSDEIKPIESDMVKTEKNNSCTSQSELGNFSASSKSDSSVYEFGPTEYNTAPIQSWSNHKDQDVKKKIGVSIIRHSKGYRAFLL